MYLNCKMYSEGCVLEDMLGQYTCVQCYIRTFYYKMYSEGCVFGGCVGSDRDEYH